MNTFLFCRSAILINMKSDLITAVKYAQRPTSLSQWVSKNIFSFRVYACFIFLCLFYGCEKYSPSAIDVNIVISPQEIKHGDSFIVILSSNSNEYIPEIDLNNVYSDAESVFIYSNNRNDNCVSVYKIKPKKKGVFIFKKSMIVFHKLRTDGEAIPFSIYFENNSSVDVR